MARVAPFRPLRGTATRRLRTRRRRDWPGVAMAAAGFLLALALGTAWLSADRMVGDSAVAEAATQVPGPPEVLARFAPCRSGAEPTCITDGDTFRLEGVRIRIADIDTPETRQAQCPAERRLADRATLRLTQLLNAGPFTLLPADRDEDRYGRKLRIVARDGVSLGGILVSEGLARRWDGARHPWC